MVQVKIGVLEQIGYREWTEEIGDDREWRIQRTQALFYSTVQDAASRRGGFVIPVRYDYMLVLASSLDARDLAFILETAKGASPVPVRMAAACGSTPVEAADRAWKLLPEAGEGGLAFEACEEPEYVAVGHLDINNITEATRSEGVVKTYTAVMKTMAELATRAYERGAITQYLGGDNVLVVLPIDGLSDVIEDLVMIDDLKAGVGVAASARRALELAARALRAIRTGRVRGRIYEIRELPAQTGTGGVVGG